MQITRLPKVRIFLHIRVYNNLALLDWFAPMLNNIAPNNEQSIVSKLYINNSCPTRPITSANPMYWP